MVQLRNKKGWHGVPTNAYTEHGIPCKESIYWPVDELVLRIDGRRSLPIGVEFVPRFGLIGKRSFDQYRTFLSLYRGWLVDNTSEHSNKWTSQSIRSNVFQYLFSSSVIWFSFAEERISSLTTGEDITRCTGIRV